MIDIQALIALAQEAVIEPHILEHPDLGAPLLVMPGHGEDAPRLVDLSQYLANPNRIPHGNDVGVIEVDHFIEYVNTYAEPRFTALFASLSKGTVSALIDYHKANAGVEKVLRHGDHRCALTLAPDPDWVAWTSLNGKYLSQDEFAQFLDSQQWVIIEPDAATIRDIVLRFQATSITKFERPVYDEASGSVKVNYVNEAEQKGGMKLPSSVFLNIAPYRSAPYQQVEAKLRWRFRDGSVAFGFEIVRPDRIAEAAFREVLDKIEQGTGFKPYLDA